MAISSNLCQFKTFWNMDTLNDIIVGLYVLIFILPSVLKHNIFICFPTVPYLKFLLQPMKLVMYAVDDVRYC
jgi:hypothetical protein